MARAAVAMTIMAVPSLWRPLLAQRLSGTTVGSIDGVALRGVVVSLVDARGTAIQRTVSGPNGRFVLPVTDEVRAVQIRRIGYTPRDVAIPDSAHRTTAFLDIRLDPLPAVLDPVVVSDSAAARSLSAELARALWEQARMAYLATQVAQQSLGDSVRVMVFEHSYRPKKPVSTHVRVVLTDSGRMFAASRSPESFAAEGFGLDIGKKAAVIQAPDFGVLMHESFAATHRFSMADYVVTALARRPAGQVGIVFEPNPGRESLVDIRGVLWMDRSPLALRSAQFRFVGGSVLAQQSFFGASFGQLNFDMVENGAVIIRDWGLVLPAGREGDRRIGGVLAFAKWADGTRFERHFPHVTGTVFSKGAPYPGAQVAISDTPYRGVTGHNGSFDIPDVFPGFYTVTPFDSTLAAFGIAAAGAGVRLESEVDTTKRVKLKLDPLHDVARSACRGKTFGAGDGVLGIRLIDSAGAGVQGPIALSLRLDADGRERRVVGETNGAAFVICGTRPGRVTVEVTGAAWVGTTGRLLAAPGKVVDTVTLVVRPRR